jgi:hypothetical protein
MGEVASVETLRILKVTILKVTVFNFKQFDHFKIRHLLKFNSRHALLNGHIGLRKLSQRGSAQPTS